jgi:hypothetical protein
MSRGLVIAVYKEDIKFLKEIEPFFDKIYVYTKFFEKYEYIINFFNSNKYVIENLENIGRESHTYAYHIHKYYDNLEDSILFIQGNPFDHCNPNNFIKTLNESYNSFHKEFIPFSDKVLYEPVEGHDNYVPARFYPQICSFLKRENIYNDKMYFFPGAQFFVSKKKIQSNPNSFYTFLYYSHYAIEVMPYMLERLWLYIFINNESEVQTIIQNLKVYS